MKKLLAVLLFIAAPALADDVATGVDKILWDYDLDATSNIYCRYITPGIGPGGPTTSIDNGPGVHLPPTFTVTTAGVASVTIDATNGAQDVFNNVTAGDLLEFHTQNVPGTTVGQPLWRVVATKASADQITVGPTGATLLIPTTPAWTFVYWPRECGTGANNGWFSVAGNFKYAIGIQVSQMNVTAGGITYQVECRHDDQLSVPEIVDTGNITAASTVANNPHTTHIEVPYHSCRVGLLLGTDDGGDTGANAEKVSISVTRYR